jgi:hypothetical protein
MSDRYWNFERYRTSGQSFAMAMLFALVAALMVAMNWGLPARNYGLAASMAAISGLNLWLGIRAKRREKAMSPAPRREAGA